MLTAVAFLLTAIIRIRVVLWLDYDPKDIVIAFGGFLFGPMAAFTIAVVASLIEMVTISETGFFGLVMNIVSSASFSCTAAYIYHKNRTLKGAIIGLVAAVFATTIVMVAWNYLIIPIYIGAPRSEAAELLIPAIIPFNLIKGGLNAAFALLLYKPIMTALRAARVLPQIDEQKKTRISPGVIIASIFVIATCVLWIMMLQGIFS